MIVAGFGFRASAPMESLREALELAAGDTRIDALATVTGKADSGALCQLAGSLDLQILSVTPEDLARQVTETRSEASIRAHGTGSVAEASALAGAGANARLLTPRRISADGSATCALAEGDRS